jgi:hypothetical protein
MNIINNNFNLYIYYNITNMAYIYLFILFDLIENYIQKVNIYNIYHNIININNNVYI